MARERTVELFGKRYRWVMVSGRWSLRPNPWRLLGATEDGDRLYLAPAGTEPS